MNKRTMRRDDWTRILEKEVIIRDFQWKGRSGKISLLKILKVINSDRREFSSFVKTEYDYTTAVLIGKARKGVI